MDFGANKTPIEILKEGAFGGTYFRDIYPGVNGKWCKKSWKRIVSRFRRKLVKMIKDSGSKHDDYSISPKISQILLHWSYELTGKDFFY